MADQGKWWKLWCASLRDDDLENLSIHDWFGWARLGAHIKEHGKEGKLRLRAPATAIVNLLRVPDFEAAIAMIKRFPNYTVGERNLTVSPETFSPVSIEIEVTNWWKYQGDFSSERVRRFRDKKRHSETVQEEKRRRREEKRGDETKTPSATDGRVTVLIASFFEGLKTKTGEKPVLNFGEAGKVLKSLLLTFPQDEIQKRFMHWFASNEPFVVKVGWRFSEFHRNFNQLKEGPLHATANRPANAFVATSGESAKYDARNK